MIRSRAKHAGPILLPMVDPAEVEFHAQRRQRSKQGVTERKIGRRIDPLKANRLGVGGELAVAAYLNLDVHTHDRKEGDSGADFRVNGHRLEVKTRAYSGDDLMLMVPGWQARGRPGKERPDVLVLVREQGARHLLMGWVTWARFKRRHLKRCRGHRDCARPSRGPHILAEQDWCTHPDWVMMWGELNAAFMLVPWLYQGVDKKPWTLTPQALAAAIQRDDHNHSAVLMPDGETVLAPDEDMGFTVALEEWTRAGGRQLGLGRYDADQQRVVGKE